MTPDEIKAAAKRYDMEALREHLAELADSAGLEPDLIGSHPLTMAVKGWRFPVDIKTGSRLGAHWASMQVRAYPWKGAYISIPIDEKLTPARMKAALEKLVDAHSDRWRAEQAKREAEVRARREIEGLGIAPAKLIDWLRGVEADEAAKIAAVLAKHAPGLLDKCKSE